MDKKIAEQKFKEISEAYQILGDPQRRRQYDNKDQFGFEHFHFMNERDLFSQFDSMGFFDDILKNFMKDDDFFGKDSFSSSNDFFGFGNIGNIQSFSSFGNSGNFQGGYGKSVSQRTIIQNGQKVTVTTTTTRQPDGTTHTETIHESRDKNGRVERKFITNGEPQERMRIKDRRG